MLDIITSLIGVTAGIIIVLKVVQYEMKQAKIQQSQKTFF